MPSLVEKVLAETAVPRSTAAPGSQACEAMLNVDACTGALTAFGRSTGCSELEEKCFVLVDGQAAPAVLRTSTRCAFGARCTGCIWEVQDGSEAQRDDNVVGACD